MSRHMLFRILNMTGSDYVLKKLRLKNQEVSILTFHRVSDERDRFWPSLPVKVFEKLIDYLAKHTKIIPVEELPFIGVYPEKPIVCISFDDGYRDFYVNALPVLQKYHVPSHHNICPGLVDRGELPWPQLVNIFLKNNRGCCLELPNGEKYYIKDNLAEADYLDILSQIYSLSEVEFVEFISSLREKAEAGDSERLMNWTEIRECVAAGVNIGSHSNEHRILYTLDDEQLRCDISESNKRIFEELGTHPKIFTFPSGLYDERSLKIVEEFQFEFLLICEDKTVPFRRLRETGPKLLTRINIAGGSFAEEKLRALGFHQRVKRVISGLAYV